MKSAQHIIAFLVAKNGLEQVKPIAAKLQKKDQDIVHAYNMIDSTIDNVKELRKNIKDDWFVDATRIANEIGSEISLPRIAGRQIYRANALADGATTEDYFRVNVAIPFVDHLEQQLLESRVGKDLFALVPSLC